MNDLIPNPVKIQKIIKFTPQIRQIRIVKDEKNKKDRKFPAFNSGQIIMVSVLGVGEAAFGITSSPFQNQSWEFLYRRVGRLTTALDSKKVNDTLFIRGPYGNGFPIKEAFEKDIILVAGGTGIAPLASFIEYIIKQRNKFNRVYLLYGAKTPYDILMKERLLHWKKSINICLTVEEKKTMWKDHTGFVSELCEIPKIDPNNTLIAMVGPPVMYETTRDRFVKLGIKDNQIYIALERKMRCATGTCQHCNCGKYLICTSGHIFRWDQIKGERI